MIDELLSKIQNKRLVVIVAPVLVTFLLAFGAILNPAFVKVSRLEKQKEGLSSNANTYTEIITKEKKLSLYSSRFASFEDKAKSIEELNNFAVQSGLSISSVVPEERKVEGPYLESLLVKIEMEGNYHQLGDFVSKIENMKTFTKVISVDINTESRGLSGRQTINAAAGTYKISVGIGLYYPQKGAL